MFEIDKYGIGKVMDMATDHLAHKEHIHLSYDIDALDPFYAPRSVSSVIIRKFSVIDDHEFLLARVQLFEAV